MITADDLKDRRLATRRTDDPDLLWSSSSRRAWRAPATSVSLFLFAR